MKYRICLLIYIFLYTTPVLSAKRYIDINQTLNIPLIPVSCIKTQPQPVSKKKIKNHISNLTILMKDTFYTAKKIKKDTKTALDLKDEYYLKMQSSETNSSLLATLTLELAENHMQANEYLIAEYYVKKYMRDYPFAKALDRARYIQIKSLFMQFKKSQSQENVSLKIIELSHYFSETFIKSKYKEKVAFLLKEFVTLVKKRNEEIALYYEKIGKKKAALYYRKKSKYLEMRAY